MLYADWLPWVDFPVMSPEGAKLGAVGHQQRPSEIPLLEVGHQVMRPLNSPHLQLVMGPSGSHKSVLIHGDGPREEM